MTITLKICTRKAFVVETQLLTSGSVGIEVEFSFSDAWDDLNKVAVFRGSGANIDMVLTGDSCTVPPEVLAQPGGHLMIGVYGTNGAGTIVIPTVWANAGPILLGAIPSGIEPEEITPSLLQQLLDLIHGGSSELYIVSYDQRAPTIPNVNEIAAAFDAGKAVLASATDADGGGHVLPLTAITRESGAVTALHFYAGGWSLGVGKIGTQWLPYLSEIEQPIADLVLTFRGAWNDRTGAYYVSTDANLQHFGTALREGRHIDARLYVHPVEGDTDRFSDRVLRQGTVCVVYVGEDTRRLDTVTVSFFGEAGEIWELSGTSDGWELEQLAIGGGSIELDTTLSQPGKAADAAAVGTALAAKGTYSKPSGGIPASDLASAVQTSLGKADTAYQKPSGGIPASDLAAGVIPSLSGYATEQWVQNQGYLTQHQSLSAYQPKAITDTGGYYTTDTVEGALQEIGAELAGGLSDSVKQALLTLLGKVAYVDDQGQTYYDTLYDALYSRYWRIKNALLHCISSNGAERIIKGESYTATITATAGYTLAGATVSITMGGADITSTAYSNGIIAVPTVTGVLVISVEAAPIALSSITAVFAQGNNVIYDTDTLDTLKQYLAVTAHYSDNSTATVSSADYTLSGTLTAGTSTITVSYGGKTATFNVTVTADVVMVTHTFANNRYRAISDPNDMVLTVGMVASGGTSPSNGRVDPTAAAVPGRCADTERVLVGNYGGKTLGLSSYTLSSGASVAFSCWFGKLANNEWSGSSCATNSNNKFIASAWITENTRLPASSDTNVLVMAFRKGNGNIGDFTQAELTEIPTLVRIY